LRAGIRLDHRPRAEYFPPEPRDSIIMTARAAPSDRALASAPNGALKPTACIVLADGQVFYGRGFGATGVAVAELCFNTAMTGYQEIMTDPSYAGQIVTFTFPHIGNVGTNPEDDENADPGCFRLSMHIPTNSFALS
jgi:hypothetical protein